MTSIRPLWLAFMLLPSLALAPDEAGVPVRSYALPGHGGLELQVPSSWKESIRRPPLDLPPTIEYSPVEGNDFNVQITPLWSPEARPGFNSAEAIRSIVERIGREHLAESVETEITLKGIKGPEAAGYAFTLTDRAPKEGEWKYFTSGAVGLGDLLITFTILTNRLDGDELRQALRMIEESRQVGVLDDAPPATAATSTLRKLTYPGKKWSLVLDLPGFEFEQRATRQGMTGVMVFGNNPGTRVIISIYLEKADHPGDGKAFRELYWSKTKRARPASKDVRFSERGNMALLERTVPRVKDIELNQEHLNAFMSYDGVWIDIHLSKVNFRPEDQPLFDAILDTVQIADPGTVSRVGSPGAAARPHVSSLTSLPVPGRNWTVELDTLGASLNSSLSYRFEQDGVEVTGQKVVGSQHEGGSEKTGLVFLISIGEDTSRRDSRSLRDGLWKENSLSLGGRPRDVRFHEQGEWAFVDFTLPKVEGKKADIRTVGAYLWRDSIAIAMAVSKVDYRPEDAPAFEAVLNSIRVAESAPTPP